MKKKLKRIGMRMWEMIRGLPGLVWKTLKKFRRNPKLPDPVAELLPYARKAVVETAHDFFDSPEGKRDNKALKKLMRETREWTWNFSTHVFREALEHSYNELFDTEEYIRRKEKEERDRKKKDENA